MLKVTQALEMDLNVKRTGKQNWVGGGKVRSPHTKTWEDIGYTEHNMVEVIVDSEGNLFKVDYSEGL